jgi:hypothetical protein
LNFDQRSGRDRGELIGIHWMSCLQRVFIDS